MTQTHEDSMSQNGRRRYATFLKSHCDTKPLFKKKKPYRHISIIFSFSFFPSGGVTLVGLLPTGLPRLFEAGFVHMYLESLNFSAIHHNDEGIGHVDHIFQAYETRVVHQLKDPCLVQHIGGAVAAVEGGDGCAHMIE